MNPGWEDVRGKSVGFHTLTSMPHSTHQPALEQLAMLSSGEGAELALDPTKNSPAAGLFLGPFPVALGGSLPLGRSSEWEGLATQLLRGGILITPFNLVCASVSPSVKWGNRNGT